MNPDKEELSGTREPLIGIVGPCAAGKSTLIASLSQLGYRTRHIAQEHSFVKDMWKRLTNPDILVYLEASYATTVERRHLNWNESEWQEQQHRLRHARENADLYLETDNMSVQEVLAKVVAYVDKYKQRIPD